MPMLLEKPEVRLGRPLTFFDQMRDKINRIFESLPLARPNAPVWRQEMLFVPAIEVQEKKGVLLVKADLPGLKREEVTVEVTAQGLTITGERKAETNEENKKEGYFRTERLYGKFYRFVPVPEGALVDKATATFKEGVLEVQVPLPKEEKLEPKKLAIS